ncbi:MAG TPA: FliH/SctL family protein [Candidatus Sulfotelmatobacter sp.]|jgi:flagellar assembly protein FliH
MSSSPSRSALASSVMGDPATPVREMSPFPYPELASGAALPRGTALPPLDSRIQPAIDTADREMRARVLGREEGQAEARKTWEEQLTKERAMLGTALTQFAQDRTLYYQNVETEVVQLALSIACHILHREAQIDPLLLAGVVRVALEKIEKATGVTLRIHPHNAADWRRFFAVHLDPANVPEIVEDSAIAPDRCILETSMGTAELGMEVQLKEIEKGLMDLLAARPEKTP